jgi:hypothetical protein
MAARSGSLVVAVTFEAEVDVKPVLVHAGDVLPATDPVVKGRERLFEPVAETSARSARKSK